MPSPASIINNFYAASATVSYRSATGRNWEFPVTNITTNDIGWDQSSGYVLTDAERYAPSMARRAMGIDPAVPDPGVIWSEQYHRWIPRGEWIQPIPEPVVEEPPKDDKSTRGDMVILDDGLITRTLKHLYLHIHHKPKEDVRQVILDDPDT